MNTTITLDDIKAAQAQLGKMITTALDDIKVAQSSLVEKIAILEANRPSHTFEIPSASIALMPGEQYAGIILGHDVEPNYHLILLHGQAESIAYDDALKWVLEMGGELPTRREQALLFANFKREFDPAWYWSSARHEQDKDYAWYQHFGNGSQGVSYLENKLCARVVRREYF